MLFQTISCPGAVHPAGGPPQLQSDAVPAVAARTSRPSAGRGVPQAVLSPATSLHHPQPHSGTGVSHCCQVQDQRIGTAATGTGGDL